MIYLIGSLRNPRVPIVANELRDQGFEVFDDWYAAGPHADEHWQAYEMERGNDFLGALCEEPAEHVYSYDLAHLDEASAGVMLAPCGRSGHLELGYLAGKGVPTFVYLDRSPERWDVMLKFADRVVDRFDNLVAALNEETW